MKLKLYNTLTRQKEIFVPLMEDPNYQGPKKDFVGMYSCGPTVYSTSHIGNLRATFTADLIRNTLQLLGYKVQSVMNITDVGHLVSDADEGEDKMEKGSRREGKSAWDIAKQYEKIFKENMKQLNIDQFDVMPRATEHIEDQINLIKILEKKGYTYTVEGDGIYMDTSKVENYGELMGPNYKKRLVDLNAGERVDMRGKKHATDFALRKFSPKNEQRQMERESPRGKGFPGRHIECSAMSSKYLGKQFDIHHGGADHITIHHPNEIAQSECGFDVHPRVKYWIHNEFLQVDGGKMSKSLGNMYTLQDISEKKKYQIVDLRYFYFMANYRSFQNFTWDSLRLAASNRFALFSKIYTSFVANNKKISLVDGLDQIKSYPEFINNVSLSDNSIKRFTLILESSLCDDFNTVKLLAEVNKLLNFYTLDRKNESQDNVFIDDVLKFVIFLDYTIFKFDLWEQIKSASNTKVEYLDNIEIPAEVISLADQRIEAKKNKDYTLADELRNKITALGFQVKDTKDGYEITKI